MKRKSQKAVAPPAKKYNYYVDNFDDNKDAKSTRPPVKMEFSTKNEEAPQAQQRAPINFDSHPINPTNRSVSPMLENIPVER